MFPSQKNGICPKVILLFFFLLKLHLSLTQSIPVEIMAGHKRVFGTCLIVKPFSDSTRFGFFGLTNFHGSYDNKSNELVTTNQLTFRLNKHFNLAAGCSFNGLLEFFPYAGFQFGYFKKNILVVLNQGVEIIHGGNNSSFGIVEWKPRLTTKLSAYMRFQGLFIYSFAHGTHNRSFVYFRLGLNCKRFSYGLGANLDYYGKDYAAIPNYGLFARYEF